ncbi:pentapeptide repeat-containing protein [Micromonospora sp. WMMA1363]|uniref:pentapeptide repeat-containing protein n=1 Tax=Micromonospora sp. WMMA1363 TaxID=3053985 RepID=UPI00259CB425|nr:pentapeptide repeat-containing protein [Micromonospora sp. WMMA1363]MDM4720152.1 pentapeptide repeat-containing protein [Micromonospora sp. WMMA1363]
MRTTTAGDVTILLPDLDPEELDPVTDLTDDDLRDGLVEEVSWRGRQIEDQGIRGCRITASDLGEITWEGGALYGCEVARTDLSGAALTGVSIERCSVTGSRFTGTRLIDVRLKDVLFDNCRFDYATLSRVSAAGSVAFTDCALVHGTWSSCRLSGVALRSCDLSHLELDACRLDGADLRGSRLHAFATALDNLQGIALTEDQLPDLTRMAVDALSIDVRADAAGGRNR